MTEETPNRIHELVDRLDQEGRIDQLESELEAVDRGALTRDELHEWWRFFGIGAFQRGEETLALERFKGACEQFPDSSELAFSLGQQYVRTGNIDRGFEVFSRVAFPDVPREYVLAQVRYAYLAGRYDSGLAYLKPFLDGYKQLKILDDHFLYVRGMPFFSVWWGHFAALHLLSGTPDAAERVLGEIEESCHDYDFDHLRAEWSVHRTGESAEFIRRLKIRVAEQEGATQRFGGFDLTLAILEARKSSEFAESAALLNAVAFGEDDFPWLEDIRALALASEAARFDDSSRDVHVGQFLDNQPMLLEPNFAYDYFMLDFQDQLKPQARLA